MLKAELFISCEVRFKLRNFKIVQVLVILSDVLRFLGDLVAGHVVHGGCIANKIFHFVLLLSSPLFGWFFVNLVVFNRLENRGFCAFEFDHVSRVWISRRENNSLFA